MTPFSPSLFRSIALVAVLGTVLSGCALTAGSSSTDGGLFVTTDHGVTWEQVGPLAENLLLTNKNVTVAKNDPSGQLWIGTTTVGAWRSTDRMQWTNELTSSALIRDIGFSGPEGARVVMATNAGVYIRDTADAEWRYVVFDAQPVVAILTWKDNRILTASGDGALRLSVDGGTTWVLVDAINRLTPLKDITTDGSDTVILARSDNTFQVSHDRGEHWATVDLNTRVTAPETAIHEPLAVRIGQGAFWLGAKSGFYRSTDDGQHWTYVPTLLSAEEDLHAIHFSASNQIMLAVGNRILWSQDAGAHWASIVVPTKRFVTSIVTNQEDGHDLWIVGANALKRTGVLF